MCVRVHNQQLGNLSVIPRTMEDEIVLDVVGEADVQLRQRLKGFVADLAEGGWSALCVDLSGVTFIDAGGIRAIIDLLNEADGHGIRLHPTICNGLVWRIASVVPGVIDQLGLEPPP